MEVEEVKEAKQVEERQSSMGWIVSRRPTGAHVML